MVEPRTVKRWVKNTSQVKICCPPFENPKLRDVMICDLMYHSTARGPFRTASWAVDGSPSGSCAQTLGPGDFWHVRQTRGGRFQQGVRIGSAQDRHRVGTGSAQGRHRAAQGRHRVSTGSAQGRHRVSTYLASTPNKWRSIPA